MTLRTLHTNALRYISYIHTWGELLRLPVHGVVAVRVMVLHSPRLD